MEGTIASVPPQGGRKHPQQNFLQVDTTNILFICGGALDSAKLIDSRARKFNWLVQKLKVIKRAINVNEKLEQRI